MGTTEAARVMDKAKAFGAGLEATRAVESVKAEKRAQRDLQDARVRADEHLAALVEAADWLSGTEIAALCDLDSRQTIWMRVKRHAERKASK